MTMTSTQRIDREAKWTVAKNRDNAAAVSMYPTLAAVKIADVPLMSNDRHMPRKEQAAMARELFKHLGLRGISVKTPNYSMASTVDVRLPKLCRHDEQAWPHHHDHRCCGPVDGHSEETRCRTCRIESEAVAKVGEILAAAFPNHDDRSDSQSDYFDFCWSVA